VSRDYRDLVIEAFADEGAQLREALADVAADRDSYRELAQEAIHRLHDAQRQQQQQQAQHAGLVDEHRRLLAQLMTKALTAA
jgi:GTP1/Obg family GTP-binding protein